MTAFLPGQDPNVMNRAQQLAAARSDYQFNYTHVSPLALVDRVPLSDEFAYEWVKSVGLRVLNGLANTAEIEFDEFRKRHNIMSRYRLLENFLQDGRKGLRGIRQLVEEALQFTGRIGADARTAESLDEYSELFHTIGLPPISKNYSEDRMFARMRVAGPNSVMLQAIDSLDERFPVTNEHFKQAQPDDSLTAAFAEGRMFLADYAALDNIVCGSFPDGPKYVYAPLALFVVQKLTGDLMPIAIQAKQIPGPKNPIFTPAHGNNWLIAKTIVEIADGNIHEAVTHLGRTHLFVEPFVVSTFRQLAGIHPVARLLVPHFEGTMAINEAAWKHLVANKGAVDKLCAGTIAETRRLTAEGVQSFKIDEAMLPKMFAARGTDNVDRLPDYPYRDDSILYWKAIRNWTNSYLRTFYETDADVVNDVEIQAWQREIAAQDGGRLNGFHPEGMHSIDYLADVVTLVIHTSSVQHAAVNFPQFDLMSYVPNMPLAGYAPAPESTTGATEQDYLKMLPPMDMAELQMNLGHLLGTVHYTCLGQYSHGYFHDRQTEEPLKTFQRDIETIGTTIADRNTKREPYEFLVPNGIPQSINI